MVAIEMMGDYVGFDAGSGGDTLVIHFSHRDVLPGRFSQVNALQGLKLPILFLNCPRLTWYREGIPGLGKDPRETANSIRRFASERGFKRTACTGFSMGGYGALLYGALSGADKIIAFSAEAVLNFPFARSVAHLRRQPSDFDSVIPLLQGRDKDSTHIVVGEVETADMLQASILEPLATIHMLADCNHGTMGRLHRRDLLNPFLSELIFDSAPTSVSQMAKPFPTGWAEPMEGVPDPMEVLRQYERLYGVVRKPRLAERVQQAEKRIRQDRIWPDETTVEAKAAYHAQEKRGRKVRY